jgi:hypothetical protein
MRTQFLSLRHAVHHLMRKTGLSALVRSAERGAHDFITEQDDQADNQRQD